MAFKDWSTTAADNDDADATINWLEGQSPATVNNSARAVMAALASWRDLIDYGTVSGGTVGGSANAITLTNSPTVGAREAGRRYLFQYTSTGVTGATTLVVDGLTSGAIQYLNAALVSGDIATNDWVLVADDGTNFQLLTPPRVSPYKIINTLTADATPDGAADYLVTYDASASLPKKVLLNALGATAAQMEAGTSNDVYATPGSMIRHDGVSKFWTAVTVSGGTPTTNDSLNQSSLDDDGASDFGLNFTTAFSSAGFAPAGWCRSGVAGAMQCLNADTGDAQSTTTLDIRIRRGNDLGSTDPEAFGVVIFGDR